MFTDVLQWVVNVCLKFYNLIKNEYTRVGINILNKFVLGEDYVFFYFTQHAYGWNYTHYTFFLATSTVITSIGLLCLLELSLFSFNALCFRISCRSFRSNQNVSIKRYSNDYDIIHR